MKSLYVATALLICSVALRAEEIVTNLPPIKVTAAAQTAEGAAIHEALRAEPGLTVNSQGGAQNDLSIRGSSFSGAGLSLGGLTLRNPQTEHFNAELPLPAAMLSRPSLRTGLANQGGHLTGTAGFDLLPISGEKRVQTGFGSDHRDWQSALVQHRLTEQFGLGIFGGRESAEGVDYKDNDYDRAFGGGHLQYREDDTQVDALVAHQEKEFGARGYYGVSDTLPATEKTDDTLVYLAARKGDLEQHYLRGGVSWRQFLDDYELPTLAYRNQHRSRVSSAFFDGRTFEVNGWALGWRADAEEERIASSGLGHFHRTRGGVSLLPQWRGDRLKIVGGLRSEFFTDESPHYLPQLGLEYQLTDNLSTFASYTETVRLPSYTELNYDSPASLGNTGLQPQTEQQTEVGFKGIPSESTDWKIAAFHRRSKNTVDWMNTTNSSRWVATDIGTLDVYGAEARLGWYPTQNLEAQFSYTWICKDRSADDFDKYASRYALDYPEHQAQATLLWRPIRPLELGTVQSVRVQTANAVRTSDNVELQSSAFARITPPKAEWMDITFAVNNLFDEEFEVFPGQRVPERQYTVALTLKF